MIFELSIPKQDLLDEVSETEDIITRKKALERGDKLMTAFWDTMEADIPQAKSGPSLAVTAVAIAAAGLMRQQSQTWGFTSSNHHIVNTGDVRSKGATTALATRKRINDVKQQVHGPGGALSLEAAETCLQLLADAKEAYEGQGFALQADGAAK